MKLYHHPLSSSARRVGLTVAHLGLELEHRLIDLTKPEDRAALVAINPNNKIPVLQDGDFVLWESHAIMQHLCEQTPGQTLYPAERRARGDVTRWLFWVSSHLDPSIGAINFERMWKKLVTGGDPDEALIKRYEAFFHQTAAVLDRHLADRTWISGKALTLADLSVAAMLMYARPTKLPVEGYKNVLALIDRVQALDAWKATEPPRWG
jgi:glutathione S-transferase